MPSANTVSVRNFWRSSVLETDVGSGFSTMGRAAANRAGRRVILLVHGYNVSRRGARRAFERFEENLLALSSRTTEQEKLRRLVADCCWVTWPGDAPVPLVRALAYWRKVGNARACAEPFAEYLDELSADISSTEVVIIAHSLGCR